ncbi:MAG: ATPase [Prevotellaceae bacterium]|jgi:AAA+ ATPase superfamily predicted ATPase|nr:ATPase [Prevotellaceae bacterium]
MKEETPFVFGKIADTENFTDRESESNRLYQNFTSLINTIIISPRRWGKTSLVKSVAKQVTADNKNIKICMLDIFNVKTESDFYLSLAQNVLQATSSKWEELAENAKHFLSRLLPQISFSPDAQSEISFGISWEELKKNADEILDLAETIAKAKNIKIVVCIDEFQSINEFENPLAFQRKLRSHWQQHQQVTYCLFGSKRSMLLDIFSNVSMPFYKFGDIMFLDKIDNDIWGDFIQKRFRDTKKDISIEDAKMLAGLVENHPYYVQQIAQQSWLRTKKMCDVSIIMEAYEGVKNQLSLLFVGLIESLTNKQIDFLHAIVAGETSLSSKDILAKYKLGTSANVIKIRETLLSKEIIDVNAQNIEIQDPIFKIWLKTDYFKMRNQQLTK